MDRKALLKSIEALVKEWEDGKQRNCKATWNYPLVKEGLAFITITAEAVDPLGLHFDSVDDGDNYG